MPNPVSPAVLARSRSVAEPRWSPNGARLAWVEAFGGRADVLVAPADGSGPGVVVTSGTSLASVGAYGGGVFCWGSPDELVVVAADGRVLALNADRGTERVLSGDGRASSPAARDGVVAFALEREDACDIARVPLDGSGWPARVSEGADFAWDPSLAANGRVAWHEWDLPDMSWDASRILVDGKVVAGGDGVSVGQPRFSPDGLQLAYVTDVDGFWNVWVADADGGRARPLLREGHEQAEPAWGPGQRSFAWSPDGKAIALNRNESGFGRLVIVDLDGGAREISKGWHHGLDWGPAGIVCVRSARGPHRRSRCSTRSRVIGGWWRAVPPRALRSTRSNPRP